MPGQGRGLSSRRTHDAARDRGLGNLSTPRSVQKLQTALHGKTKAEADYRFYALCDKISREDILAYAYAQRRSNKARRVWKDRTLRMSRRMGSSGGSANERLRSERRPTNRLRSRACISRRRTASFAPLGISTLRDRLCMEAATLVLEPIFEADLPPEQYAYRSGRNAGRAVAEVGELLFRSYRDPVDADLADYFGGIPYDHWPCLSSPVRGKVSEACCSASFVKPSPIWL